MSVHHSRKADIIAQAIAERRSIAVTYNGSRYRLHPHQLYARHDAIILRAFNPAKNRRADGQPVLGHFHFAGLSDCELENENFEPLSDFDLQLGEGDRSLLHVYEE